MNDGAASVLQNPDGTIALTGSSRSEISGEKTEINFGESDYWVVKLDANALKVAQNSSKYRISAYPNPTRGKMNIAGNEKFISATLYDNAGRKIQKNCFLWKLWGSLGFIFFT